MSISAKDVKQLREMTGAGMMDCKKALAEANGNFDEAVVILRKKGQKVSAKRADKEANEGVVVAHANTDATEGLVIALNCETDFVAKGDDFVALANLVLKAAIEAKPTDIAALKAVSVDGKTVEEYLTDAIGKIQEKIEITAYEYVSAEKVITYIHSNAKLGVLLALQGTGGADTTELGKDIAMQIAAMNPVGIDKDDVDPSVVEREVEIGKEQARQEGKPENIIEKIALGKLNKFYKENTLVNQLFVKDSSKTIGALLKEVSADLKVIQFNRVTIG